MATPGVVVHVVVASVVQAACLQDCLCLQVKPDDNVTLEFVEIDGAIVDYLARARPGVWETVRGKIVCVHEVHHGLVLTDKAVVVITIHVPNLWGKQTSLVSHRGSVWDLEEPSRL